MSTSSASNCSIQYNIAYGVLEPLLGGNSSRNLDEAAALCSAMNDWQML